MIKKYASKGFNQLFDDKTGFHAVWGDTFNDNPKQAPAPNILDMEIMSGYCSAGCKFCYKDNAPHKTLKYMTLETFKSIMDKLDLKVLTQIAFGICDLQPLDHDMWAIFRECRLRGVVPNFTTNGRGLTEGMAEEIKRLCGAVAVSWVDRESIKAIQLLLNTGMKQVNIHYVVHDGNCHLVHRLLISAKSMGVNAVVLLKYKPKGMGRDKFVPVGDVGFYRDVVVLAEKYGQQIGFDSCSANMYLESLTEEERVKQEVFVEPCESGLFSAYINTDGLYYPCSFAEGEVEGIDVLACKSFTDVWNSDKVQEWRDVLLCNGRNCPLKFT